MGNVNHKLPYRQPFWWNLSDHRFHGWGSIFVQGNDMRKDKMMGDMENTSCGSNEDPEKKELLKDEGMQCTQMQRRAHGWVTVGTMRLSNTRTQRFGGQRGGQFGFIRREERKVVCRRWSSGNQNLGPHTAIKWKARPCWSTLTLHDHLHLACTWLWRGGESFCRLSIRQDFSHQMRGQFVNT